MKQNKYTTEDLINAVYKKDATVISKYDMENFKTILSSLTPDEICGDGEEWTPLMHAAGEGNVEMVKLLLPYYSLEKIAQENEESTALIHAIKHRGNPEVVRLLLDAGLSAEHIIITDEEGSTALTYAIEYSHDEIIKMLIPLLTAEQICGEDRSSALIVAIESQSSWLEHILNSITPELIAKHCPNLLGLAASEGSLEHMQILLKYLPKNNISEIAENALGSIGGGFDSESDEKMKLLLSHTSDKNNIRKKQYADDVLISAVSWDTKKIEMLLKRFSPEELHIQNNTTNFYGQTAIMLAAKWDFRQCVTVMLPYLSSEQLQMIDQKGKTAKDLAKFPQVKEMIQNRLDEIQTKKSA